MKYLISFSRFLLGIVFIVSGLTKIIDPVGFGFVISEYFNALWLPFLTPLSVLTGVLASAFEFVLGVALVLRIQMRLSSLFVMLFMVFFTFFTLWIAIYNPVQHCGCFGDAIILSNTETFLKNLVFTPFAVLLFLQRKKFPPISLNIREWSTIVLFGIASLLLAFHCYRHLPLIDFTGFKVGNHIPEAMTVPEEQMPKYETTFTYQKGLETKQFSISDLPDSTWTFVSHETRLVQAGTIPQIPFFDVSSYEDNRYVTDELLSIRGPLLILTIPYADKARTKALEKAGALYRQLMEQTTLPFVVLSGSGQEITESLLRQNGLTSPYYFCDVKTVYTAIRANPGLMLLYDASVVAKWSAWDIPSFHQLQRILNEDWEVVSTKLRIREHLSVEFFLLILVVLLGVLRLLFRPKQ